MDDYNGPYDYDGFLHENEKEVIINEEENFDILQFFYDCDTIADQIVK